MTPTYSKPVGSVLTPSNKSEKSADPDWMTGGFD
jgi:hypothetical protein